jgi:hypothetical protein
MTAVVTTIKEKKGMQTKARNQLWLMKRIVSMKPKTALLAALALLAFLLTSCTQNKPAESANKGGVGEEVNIATDAYIYGYSLVTTKITGMAFTNTVKPDVATFQAPVNQLLSQPGYPAATYHGVTAPNADTLYSPGFMDLSGEPVVLSYPNMGKRYFLFPIYDAWTTIVAAPGSRTTGGAAQKVLIAGPSWNGTVPAGMTLVKLPSNLGFIIGRIYSDGTPADLAQVHALQAQFKLVPLSAYGKAYTPPPGQVGGPYTPKEIVRDVIAKMSIADYFNFMAEAMKEAPPVLPQDAPMVARMAQIGLVPGKPFDMSKLSPETQKGLANIPQAVLSQFNDMEVKGGGKLVNGWEIPTVCGEYGTDYRARAFIAAFGWGCNLPKDAVYPLAKVDSAGNPLVGSNTYTVHFDKGETPPVDGFWSITMYDAQAYFYPNPLNKLTVSPRNKLKYNADGSLDLYFSHVQPKAVAEANWLPAPEGNFILLLRLYWPKETPPSILPPGDGTWKPPAISVAK